MPVIDSTMPISKVNASALTSGRVSKRSPLADCGEKRDNVVLFARKESETTVVTLAKKSAALYAACQPLHRLKNDKFVEPAASLLRLQ